MSRLLRTWRVVRAICFPWVARRCNDDVLDLAGAEAQRLDLLARVKRLEQQRELIMRKGAGTGDS